MQSLITLVSVLVPLLIGFFIRMPTKWLRLIDKLLIILVYIILLLIGVSLSRVENLGAQLPVIAAASALLFVCVIGLNVAVLIWFDRRYPIQTEGGSRKANVSIVGSLKQMSCMLLGFAWGKIMSTVWLPPEKLSTWCLMLLVLLVGIQLRSGGVKLKDALVSKRGMQICFLTTVSAMAGGLLFAALMPAVQWNQGVALASGFGWYSLSGIVMTEAYSPIWGSVVLLNDLAREFSALMFIPVLMRRYPSAAVGLGGATSLDFTLPVIQSAGGAEAVILAISFGFVINILAPILMVGFSSLGF